MLRALARLRSARAAVTDWGETSKSKSLIPPAFRAVSLPVAFLIAYVSAGVFFLYGHVLGDTARFAAGYFWTWDMFPNYPSFSARRFAVGQTKSGQYLMVFPTSQVRHR